MFGALFARRPTSAQRYVAMVVAEPERDDVQWLATAATGGDEDRAAWELRYLRRSIGLLVAQRDALDDRTASAVAHELTVAMQADRHVAAAMVKVAERQFNERLSAYREMMAMRGLQDTPAERVSRTLLLLSGSPRVELEAIARGAALVERWEDQAEQGLRSSFGDARLSVPGGAPPDRREG